MGIEHKLLLQLFLIGFCSFCSKIEKKLSIEISFNLNLLSRLSARYSYPCRVWGQNQNNVLFNKLRKLQNKTLSLNNFKPSNNSACTLYHTNKILKIGDFIKCKNACFVRNTLRKENPPLLNEVLNMLNQNHTYNTRAATYNLLGIPQVRTLHLGEFYIGFKASETWNQLQRNLNMDLFNCDTSDFKRSVFEIFFANYNNV